MAHHDEASSRSAGHVDQEEVIEICRDLIRIDTANPGSDGPGERQAAEYVATRLEDLGVSTRLIEAEPRRTNVIARWGTGDGPPLLIHAHLDVVPAEAEQWAYPPTSGEITDDGMLWGRGAVDMKNFVAMVLATVARRVREGRPCRRPLVLVFTADEEAGGTLGAEFLMNHHRDELADCTDAIGEVGGFSVTVRDRPVYLIETAERGIAWLDLLARGTAGHGSMRQPDNALVHLSRAISRLGDHAWPVEPGHPTVQLLETIGGLIGEPDLDRVVARLPEELGGAARMISAVLANTANPTAARAGDTYNVVPGRASAKVDGRFLPGQEDEFLATVRRLAGDDVDVDVAARYPAISSPFEGPVVDAMVGALTRHDPRAIVSPYTMSGGTDAQHFAREGMRAYGFVPMRLPPDLDFTALFHGVDERVPVDALRFGCDVLDTFLDLVGTD